MGTWPSSKSGLATNRCLPSSSTRITRSLSSSGGLLVSASCGDGPAIFSIAMVRRCAASASRRCRTGCIARCSSTRTAPVAALAWNGKGTLLAFAAEDGDAGLLEL